MEFLVAPLRLPPPERTKSSRLFLAKPGRVIFTLLLMGLLLAVVAGSEPARAQSDSSREYQIKAAFLFNFAQFVKWPENSFTSTDAPFCIGVLGEDPFGSVLDGTVQGETISNHRLIVVRAQRIEDLKECQMIFVSRSEGGHIGEILAQLESRPVLTVSEVESFAHDGGDIDFYLSDGKVRFEINPQSAQKCGLRISSQLLTLGRIVQP
jgi:YfiR/HmsC-like